MANRVNEVSAVHGVEMKFGHTVIDEIDHLFGGNRGRDQLAGGEIVIECFDVGQSRSLP